MGGGAGKRGGLVGGVAVRDTVGREEEDVDGKRRVDGGCGSDWKKEVFGTRNVRVLMQGRDVRWRRLEKGGGPVVWCTDLKQFCDCWLHGKDV